MDEFDLLLDDAVRQHFRLGIPFGSFLTSRFNSSSVVEAQLDEAIAMDRINQVRYLGVQLLLQDNHLAGVA